MKKFENKVALITGATSGIGKAIAKKMASEGATVLLIGRNLERGLELENCIVQTGGTAEFYKCDVSNEDDVNIVCDVIEEKYGSIDILVNNAGIMLESKEIDQLSSEDWNITLNTNLNGTFYMTRRVLPLMLENKGCIINNASIAGLHYYSAGRSYAYSASKAAVIQFTHQVAKNYARIGVRVNCVCPGIIDTAILGDRDRTQYAERVPMGYVGSPEDVANVVEFLASTDACYVTGAVVPIDGGASL